MFPTTAGHSPLEQDNTQNNHVLSFSMFEGGQASTRNLGLVSRILVVNLLSRLFRQAVLCSMASHSNSAIEHLVKAADAAVVAW